MLRHQRVQIVLCVLLGTFLVSTPVLADVVVPSADVTSRVIVRATASAQSGDKGSLRPGDQAQLLGEVPSWYRIRLTNGVEGFVPKRWTRVVSTTAPPTPTPPTTTTPSFTMDVVDVGTGLGILVRGQDFTLVYDGGSNDDLARGPQNRMLAFIKAVAPTLTTIDEMILSHPHRDHVELLPDLFASYQVRQVWDSGRLNPICGYRAFVTAIRDEPGVQYHTVTQDGGVGDVSFAAQDCYGQSLPAEVVHVPHSTRIETGVPIILGQSAVMTILRADGANFPNINDNSIVVRLDLGTTRILLMGDSEAGGRQNPSVAPTSTSPEGILLACCLSDLAANVLVAGHHGSKTSSRQLFLNAVGASTFIVSAGPTKYGSVVLPDQEVITELSSRGTVFRTDLNDATCGTNPAKIGPDNDGQPGGCDNVRVVIPAAGAPQVDYWRGADTP